MTNEGYSTEMINGEFKRALIEVLKMKYYKSSEIADMLNLTTQTLMLWRKKGIGPKWVKLGQNIVRYPIAEYEEWMNGNNDKSLYKTDNSAKQP